MHTHRHTDTHNTYINTILGVRFRFVACATLAEITPISTQQTLKAHEITPGRPQGPTKQTQAVQESTNRVQEANKSSPKVETGPKDIATGAPKDPTTRPKALKRVSKNPLRSHKKHKENPQVSKWLPDSGKH